MNRRAFLSLTAPGLLGSMGTSLGRGAPAAVDPVHVSACYYPWYDTDGRHWREGYDGIDRDDGPELGLYSSRSRETIRQHIAWSREFGIDNWICSWWGPLSWEDETLRTWVLPEISRANEDAAKRGETPLTFCPLYEAGGLLGLDPERGIEFGAVETEKLAEHFRHLARHFLSHPACYRIQGRPVVYLYLSRTFSGDYSRALARARVVTEAAGVPVYLVGDEVFWGKPDRARIRALDAVTSYNMHGPKRFSGQTDWTGFVAESDRVYADYREVAASEGVAFIPGILPGFDARGLGPENSHYVIPRVLKPGGDSVSFLKAQGELAKAHLDPELRTVAITSFNEWHEGTQVEPSRGAGKAAGVTVRRMFKPEA